MGCFWAELQTPAWVMHRFAVTAQALLSSVSLLWDRVCTQGQWSLTKHDSELLLKNQRADPPPKRTVRATEKRGGPAHPTSSASSGHHNTNHTHYQGDNSQHTLRKNMAGIHTKTALSPKILDSYSEHKDTSTPKHLFKTTIDKCLS